MLCDMSKKGKNPCNNVFCLLPVALGKDVTISWKCFSTPKRSRPLSQPPSLPAAIKEQRRAASAPPDYLPKVLSWEVESGTDYPCFSPPPPLIPPAPREGRYCYLALEEISTEEIMRMKSNTARQSLMKPEAETPQSVSSDVATESDAELLC